MCRWDPEILSLHQSYNSSSEFFYPIVDLTPQILPYPRVAVFQKLLGSLTQSSQNKTDLIFVYFWVAIPSFPGLDLNLQPNNQFPAKWYPILDPNSLICIPYSRVNCLKTIPFTAADSYIAHIWRYPPGSQSPIFPWSRKKRYPVCQRLFTRSFRLRSFFVVTSFGRSCVRRQRRVPPQERENAARVAYLPSWFQMYRGGGPGVFSDGGRETVRRFGTLETKMAAT